MGENVVETLITVLSNSIIIILSVSERVHTGFKTVGGGLFSIALSLLGRLIDLAGWFLGGIKTYISDFKSKSLVFKLSRILALVVMVVIVIAFSILGGTVFGISTASICIGYVVYLITDGFFSLGDIDCDDDYDDDATVDYL